MAMPLFNNLTISYPAEYININMFFYWQDNVVPSKYVNPFTTI